jgi:hypothetical protein
VAHEGLDPTTRCFSPLSTTLQRSNSGPGLPLDRSKARFSKVFGNLTRPSMRADDWKAREVLAPGIAMAGGPDGALPIAARGCGPELDRSPRPAPSLGDRIECGPVPD